MFPRLSARPRTILVLAACALLVLAFAPAQYFGRQQDDIFFVVAARSLLDGHYCLWTTPGCPAITLANPGWPLLMTPLAFFTENTGAFQALSAALLALVPVGSWLWLRRRTDDATSLLIVALTIANPLVLSQSGSVMSEIPFLLSMFPFLVSAEDRRATQVGFWSSFLLATRTAGLAMMPAAIAPFVVKNNWRGAARAAIPPLIVFGAWACWSVSATGSVAKFELLPGTYSGHLATKLWEVATRNAVWYATTWGGCFLPPALAGSWMSSLLGAVLSAACVRGLFYALKRRHDDPAALTLVGNVLLLSVWGWQYERYFLPLLPLLFWALACGLDRWAKPALTLLFVLQFVGQVAPRVGRPGPWEKPELSATYRWLADRPRPALLASVQNVRDGYLSGLPNVPLPDAESPRQMADVLKARRVNYVLRVDDLHYGLDDDPTSRIRAAVERAQRHLADPRYFRPLHAESAEKTVIYEPL